MEPQEKLKHNQNTTTKPLNIKLKQSTLLLASFLVDI